LFYFIHLLIIFIMIKDKLFINDFLSNILNTFFCYIKDKKFKTPYI